MDISLLIVIISVLYASSGIISTIGYTPTIKGLLKQIPCADLRSYLIWVLTTTISFIYASVVITDPLLMLLTGMDMVLCATILILIIRLKNNT